MHLETATATRIGIGLISRGGAYLIRPRPDSPGSPLPGLWEFPGGKCDAGESPEQATRRECLEETGLAVEIVGPRTVSSHRYPYGLLELHFFDAVLADRAAEPDPESGFRWVPAEDLPGYRFPEANGPVLRELARGAAPTESP